MAKARERVERILGDLHYFIYVLLVVAAVVMYVLHFFGVENYLLGGTILMILLLFALLTAGAVRSLQSELREKFNTLSEQVRGGFIENLQHPERFVNPDLWELYDTAVEEIFSNARACLLEGEIRLTHVETLPQYYEDTLSHFQKHTFLAVASASMEEIWRRDDIYRHMENFVKLGGHVTRVFIVKDPHHLDQTERVIIAKHLACGIDIHIFQESDEVRDPEFFYFIVEATGIIALRSRVENGKISEVTVTNTRDEIEECLDVFNRMKIGSTPIKYLMGQFPSNDAITKS